MHRVPSGDVETYPVIENEAATGNLRGGREVLASVIGSVAKSPCIGYRRISRGIVRCNNFSSMCLAQHYGANHAL